MIVGGNGPSVVAAALFDTAMLFNKYFHLYQLCFDYAETERVGAKRKVIRLSRCSSLFLRNPNARAYSRLSDLALTRFPRVGMRLTLRRSRSAVPDRQPPSNSEGDQQTADREGSIPVSPRMYSLLLSRACAPV
jgi:hypothetical protein